MFVLFYIIIISFYYYLYINIKHWQIHFDRFPPPEDLSVAIINSCAAGGEVPRTKNQSKYIHYNSSGDRFYIQTTNFRTIAPSYQTILEYRTTDFLLECSFLFFSNPVTYWQESWEWNITIFNVFLFYSIFSSTLVSNGWSIFSLDYLDEAIDKNQKSVSVWGGCDYRYIVFGLVGRWDQ